MSWGCTTIKHSPLELSFTSYLCRICFQIAFSGTSLQMETHQKMNFQSEVTLVAYIFLKCLGLYSHVFVQFPLLLLTLGNRYSGRANLVMHLFLLYLAILSPTTSTSMLICLFFSWCHISGGQFFSNPTPPNFFQLRVIAVNRKSSALLNMHLLIWGSSICCLLSILLK